MNPMTMREAVETVLIETGNVRGNPVELARKASELVDADTAKKNKDRAAWLFLLGHTERAIQWRDFKPEPTRITATYANVIRNNWLRKRGIKLDKRTYRDVPGRNMIEPKHPAIVAARRYASAA